MYWKMPQYYGQYSATWYRYVSGISIWEAIERETENDDRRIEIAVVSASRGHHHLLRIGAP